MSRYVPCTETAKLVRAALKKAFPTATFSVRSSQYAGGASISVSWTDGPVQADVDECVKVYAGGRFDGMIDLAYSVTSYLMPDGSAILAESPGTENSAGSDPAFKTFKPHPDAERVRFGADSVSTSRRISDAFLASCQRTWDVMTVKEQCDFLNRCRYRWHNENDHARAVAVNVPAPAAQAA